MGTLSDPDPEIRVDALDALVYIGAAPGLLQAAFRQQTWPLWTALAERVARTGSARALEALAAGLDRPETRSAAARALAEIEDPRVPPLLVRSLDGAGAPSRRVVIEALVALGSTALDAVCAGLDLSSSRLSASDRATLCHILGKIGGNRSAAELAALLADRAARSETWHPAARALADLRWQPGQDEAAARYWAARDDWERCATLGSVAVPTLVEALGFEVTLEELTKRKGSPASALAAIGEPAVGPLLELIEGEADPRSRHAAADVLARIGSPRGAKPLLRALSSRRLDPLSCDLEALAGFLGAPLIDFLAAGLNDANPRRWEESAKLLMRIRWQPEKSLRGARYCVARSDWEGCTTLGDPAVAVLVPLLQAEQWTVRRGAAAALVSMWQAGALSERSKQRILGQREVITAPHEDKWVSTGGWTDRDWHQDEGYHVDTGIGVSFPV
ncbi:MAG: HEAT repeat domain-containing protein [Thermoanaerobaculaceae bacterium]